MTTSAVPTPISTASPTSAAAAAGDGSGYFLYHSIGMFPNKGALIGTALATFAANWGRPDDAQWAGALGLRQQYLDHWGRLIHAPAGTLTASENVTQGLFAIISALPAEHLRGRRVLIAADCFPSLHYLLAGMARRHGFVLETVPVRDQESWVREEDLIARWHADVGVALLTTVTSTASYRCDLARLISHGRAMGSLIGVDVTQSIGLLPFDVQGSGVDFLVSTSLKWLCGTPGAGVLYVRDGLLQTCAGELRGWFSQENILSWDLNAFAFAPDARRFDHGTPGLLGCVGTLPALGWYAGADADALLQHNRRLSARIRAAAIDLGLEVLSPADDARRGGATMVRIAPDRILAVVAALRAAQVYTDSRGSSLRLSPGNMTTAAGVERLVGVLAASAN